MEKKRDLPLRCAVTGGLAGIATGLFGGGGGMVLVPLLMGLCGLEAKDSFAVSVAVIAPLCLVSAGVYALGGNLPWSEALPYLLGGAAGGVIGGVTFRKVPGEVLKKGFSLLLLYGGIRCLFF
jgi:hypothetical protein